MAKKSRARGKRARAQPARPALPTHGPGRAPFAFVMTIVGLAMIGYGAHDEQIGLLALGPIVLISALGAGVSTFALESRSAAYTALAALPWFPFLALTIAPSANHGGLQGLAAVGMLACGVPCAIVTIVFLVLASEARKAVAARDARASQ